MKNLLAYVVLPAAFCAVFAAGEGAAFACGGAINLEFAPSAPTPVQQIAKAEKSLESGQNLTAAQSVFSAFPDIRNATVGNDGVETRALRVMALAVVRSDGTVDEKKAHVANKNGSEWTPASNMAWAVQALREVDEKRPNDPAVQADLGEALSKTASGQAEAMKILGGLAQKDLMGSPRAYAALAKLRSQSGDLAGAEAAIKRCEEMSKVPGVCKPAAPTAQPVAKLAKA